MARKLAHALVLLGVVSAVIACSKGVNKQRLAIGGELSSRNSDCAALKTLQVAFSPSASAGAAEVYSVKALNVDADYVVNLATKLGISGEPMEEAYRFVVSDDKVDLTVEKRTGNILFDRSRMSASSGGKNTLTDDEAVKKAEQFLEGLGLPLPGELARVERREDGLSRIVWSPKEFRPVEPYSPLGIWIAFGNDGDVVSMSYYWQELEPIGEYPLASPAEGVERLRVCDAIFNSASPSPSFVEEVRIEYMGMPPTGPFEYFVPVYHFGNDLESLDTPEGGGKRLVAGRATDAYVLAIADGYLEPMTPNAAP